MSLFFWKKKTASNFQKNKVQKNIHSVSVKVPAKLMISGEHSVIYNSKAVVCAINIFLKIKIKKISTLAIIIIDGKHKYKTLLSDLSIENKNKDTVLEIIRKFFDRTKTPMCGIKIVIKNSIPIGCGLGSSSALVSGIIFGLNELFGTKKNTTELIKMATNIEHIFHGKSSGVDIQTVVKGGVVYINNDYTTKVAHQIDEIWIINTGQPSFSTKNVVIDVSDNFSSSNKIWKEIGEITSDISEIMSSREKVGIKIAHNENCLEKIGIVTESVKTFIKDLKAHEIYGKVCGAGTIAKNEVNGNSGVVGVFQKLTKEQKKYLFFLCKKNKFDIKKVYISNAGLSINCA